MTDLNIELHMPAELASELQRHTGLLAFVREAFPVIEDADTANLAAAQRKECLAAVIEIEKRRDKYTEKAEEIIAQAKADFNPAINNAKAAAGHCGQILLDWDAKEKARVAAERRAQEEAERRIRAEAEAKAAAIRAKAEAAAREAARKAAEAAEAVRRAEADGNAKEAAKAAAAAAKQAAEAESRAEADRAKAAQVEAEAAARIAATPKIETTKIEGFSSRANWKAEFAPGFNSPEDVVLALARALFGLPADQVPIRPELVAFLELGMTACHKAARTYQDKLALPGLRAINKAVGTSR